MLGGDPGKGGRSYAREQGSLGTEKHLFWLECGLISEERPEPPA